MKPMETEALPIVIRTITRQAISCLVSTELTRSPAMARILPFGPNRMLLSNTPGWLSRLVQDWQFGGVFFWTSGQPLTVTSGLSTMTNSTTDITPDLVGSFPKGSGNLTYVSNGIQYFPGLVQIDDPSKAGVTALNSTVGSFSNKAIADANGSLLLVNPAPELQEHSV